MKIRRFAGLAVLLPIAIFSACSSASPLTLNANWYRDTTTRNITGTYEHLEYAVSFTGSDETDLKASYSGTYTVDLKDETVSIDGEQTHLYHLQTNLEIEGTFTLNGKTSDPFKDTVSTDVLFLDIDAGLRPVRSSRSVVSHTPTSDSPDNLDERTDENKNGAYVLYEYTTTTEYDTALETATVVYDETLPEETKRDSESTVKIDTKGSYFDNEQIAFALRGLDMSASFTFSTINPVKRTKESIGSSATPDAAIQPVNFTLATYGSDAEPETINRSIDAFSVDVEYKGSNPGYAQTLVYARKTNASSNQFRNLLLEMRVPVINSLGTLVYTLKSATVSNK